MKNKVLNIISATYPYGVGEQFFADEIQELSQYYDKIVLFPLEQFGIGRDIPENVEINHSLVVDNKQSKLRVLKCLPVLLTILFIELLNSDKRIFILKNVKKLAAEIIRSYQKGLKFEDEIIKSEKNFFYSFWMNEGALIFSILKIRNRINNFYFRVNGYDIYNERCEGGYMPFRYVNYKYVQKVFILSTVALAYLKALNIFKEKLQLAPYGIFNNGINKLDVDSKEIVLISCSYMIPLKRIDKIIKSLSLINDIKIRWTHFGGGPLLEELTTLASNLPNNIQFHFTREVSNKEILKFYKTEPVNIFIHTSETEGLGMAIVEAQSFGIPAVVLGVGGVPDVVSERTGIVLDPDSSHEKIAEAIRKVSFSKMNTNSYRNIIQNECLTKFNAKKNYKALSELISSRC